VIVKTLSLSLAAALALTLLGACATTPEASPPSEGAVLEVVNRTPLDLAIAVRGRVEARLRPGTRARVRELLPGPVELVARATTGGAGAFEARHALELARGRTDLWTILPDAASGPALDEPPALATLIVDNRTDEHVLVAIDGATVGRVFAGASRTFVDVPSGAHALSATPDDGRAPWRYDLELPADAAVTWTVARVGQPVTVDNGTDETLVLVIDGLEAAQIRAGASWSTTLTPGTHVAAATSQPSRRPYESVLTITDAPVTWRVDAGQAALVVDNRTGEALDVTVLGREPIAVQRGESATLSELPTGPLGLTAVGRTTRLTYAGRVDLLPGQRAIWRPEPIVGSVRIVNRTTRDLYIYRRTKDGPEVASGVLAPQGVALVRELARGQHHLAAVDPIGKRRYETAIDLSDMPADTWTIQPATGSVTIDNLRDEPVAIFVDARATGTVVAGGRRTFVGLAVGDRLVEGVGQRTGYVQKDHALVAEDRVAAVVLPDPTAFVIVDNTTGEDLETRGFLADQASAIGRAQALRFRVQSGVARLTVVGRDSGLTYQADVVAKPDAPARGVGRLVPATLTVWNQLGETVAVTIDDRAAGSVASDQTLTIADVAPGRRIVQAVGLGSGSVRSETVQLSPDADARLTLALELGVVLVEKRAAEEVAVSVDGRPYGVVRAGAIHSFGKVLPGRRTVGFDYTRSRRSAATELDVRSGQRARVVAEVPLAPVVVTNEARQDARVKVDGEVIATVGHDAPPALLHIPAGPRLVQIERLADRTLVSYRLDFWADTALHLPVPPRSTRLVVVNRLPHAAEILRAEHMVGRVEPGASALFEDLEDGEARLFARDPEGVVTHAETRLIAAGETATWVLEVAPARRP